MVANPPENFPRISPYLFYEDAAAAIEFLTRAFGLRERMRVMEPDGRISHAEVELAGAVVMLGEPGGEYRSPRRLGQATQGLYVYVDDVDAHHTRAVTEGAAVLAEPADQFYGDRMYSAEDQEGHQWYFAQHLRDVPPEELERPPS